MHLSELTVTEKYISSFILFALTAHTTQALLSCSGILCIILGLSDNHVEYLRGGF